MEIVYGFIIIEVQEIAAYVNMLLLIAFSSKFANISLLIIDYIMQIFLEIVVIIVHS